MKTRALSLKKAGLPAQDAAPVFCMLDPPDVFDLDGDRMLDGALRLPAGEADVPLYWDHGHVSGRAEDRIPIGRAKVWKDPSVPGGWLMTPVFDEADELSRRIKAKVEAGTIRACSVGYITHSARPNGRGEDVLEATLKEVSLTGIGAKEGAVRIKSMDTPEDVQKAFAQMREDVAQVKAWIGAMHGKMFPSEEKPAEKAPPEQAAPTAEADPVTKFFTGLTTK